LHALDTTTHAEESGGPVSIQGSVAGTGKNSRSGSVPFVLSVSATTSAMPGTYVVAISDSVAASANSNGSTETSSITLVVQ
jgi:hypothetical protein